MGLASWLGSKVAPKSRADMDAAEQAAGALLDPNSALSQSGDLGINTPGTAAYNAQRQAGKLLGQNVTPDFSAMDVDASHLNTIADFYRNQFLHGGMAEKAATGRATSTMADAGGSGQEGVANLRQGSQVLSKQAEAVSNAERTASGNAANENTLMAGMMDVRKMAFQSAVTHANMQKNLDATQVGYDLKNQQASNDQRLRSAQIAAQAAMQSVKQDSHNADTNLGLQMISGIGQAAAGATALGTDLSHRTPIDTSVSKDALEIGRVAAYNRQGLEAPKSAVDVYKDTAHEQLLANQSLLNSLTRSTVTYPGMPADTTDYMNNASAYPIAASLSR